MSKKWLGALYHRKLYHFLKVLCRDNDHLMEILNKLQKMKGVTRTETFISFVHLAGFSENSVGFYAAADMGIMLTKFKSESFPLTIVDFFRW